MARLYTNENFPFPTVIELRHLGHDMLTIQETGKANKSLSDDAVLAYACGKGRILVTNNRRHFVRLHLEQHDHCRIIVRSVDSDFVGLAERIHTALETISQESRPLIRINRPAS